MPNLRLITSYSQRTLLANLADNICAAPLAPLEKECIAVLSHGMSRWISMELAARIGVSAGFEFSFPNDLLDRCFSAILPELHSSSRFTQTSLTWRIASKLPALSRTSGFEQIASYLGTGRDDRRLLQISRSLTDCFDQYTIFRPEMICAWDDGEDNDWQANIWRSISNDSRGGHRAAKLRELHRHVSSCAPPRGNLPRRISLFGISYLPPFHLEALRLISAYCDVSCYLLNPCGQYWGTIISEKRKSRLAIQTTLPLEAEEYYETGNPLLSSLGTLGQEFFETLLEQGFEVDELDSASGVSNQGNAPLPSILSSIQNDIFTLFDRPADSTKGIAPADDRSVQIHSCHGAMREMEVIYDSLLGLFDKLPELEPRHIVVMIPDIETYTPYISSVFGSRSTGRPQLPYTIADRSMRRENFFIDSFLKLLTTASSRFALQETLDILEMPSVMKRFDINEDELVVIKNWLKECNVRWGFDADHRAELGFPRYDDFSWQAGLDKLFLGYAMSPDDSNSTFKGILPHAACSGRQADALGKLAEFITSIRKISQRLSEPHTMPEWADILTAMAARMLLPDENDSAGPPAVAKALDSLREASSLHGFVQSVTIDAVQDHLTGILAKSGGGYGFMGGGITFCAMMPMRSIPMRVIWLAGMNDGQFPRTETPPGFSLMNGSRRRGDRSLRDEDRYLFLEAIMAAEDCFCISYNGQSNRDNSVLPPSVLVAELMDYVSNGFVQSDEISPVSIFTRHRLQGFSPGYFDNSDPERLFSYDRETCQAIEARRVSGVSVHEFIREPLTIDPASPVSIDLQQLKRFLTNPAAAFLEQRLRVTPFNPAEEPDDSEPFSMDSLSRYNLSQELVGRIISGAGYDECLTTAKSRGALPPLSAGKAAFDTIWEKCRHFASTLEPLFGQPLEPLTIDFVHNRIHLHATIDNCQGGTHLRWRCAGLRGKDRLALWLDHLLLNAANTDGYPLHSKMIANDATLELMPLENAAETLSDLLELYCEGMKRPLRFFPETSWTYLKEGQHKSEICWRGDARLGLRGECSNQAVQLCFGGKEPWGEEFSSLAAQIYGPLADAIKMDIK